MLFNIGNYEKTFIVWIITTFLFTTLSWAEGRDQHTKGDSARPLSELRCSAEKGEAKAQNELGIAYELGRGVPKNNREAFTWYMKAAAQGLAEAQARVGRMYLFGYGVPMDHAKALSWYWKAANQGDPDGQFALSTMYMNGDTVPQDYVQGYMWSSLSAAQGNESAKTAIAYAPRFLTPAQIMKGKKLAAEWKPVRSNAVNKKGK